MSMTTKQDMKKKKKTLLHKHTKECFIHKYCA